MKHSNLAKTMAFAATAAVAGSMLFTACSTSGGAASSAATPATSAASTASVVPASSQASSSSLQTLDFATVLDKFSSGSTKSANWDRSNIVTADTTTTATIAVPESGKETKPIIMLKGNPGKLDASGAITTDPAKNSYYSSALLLKDGSAAQYGDGIYKFKEKVSGPYDKVENAMIVFKDSTPQKLLSDDSVTKALAIATVGGDVQIQRNYKNSSGATVKQELVKDTGVKISDEKYHYFILAMKDDASTTKVKLWIDGNVAYEGNVDGITGAGAVQLLQNSTPMYDSNKKPLTTKDYSGKTVLQTACAEAYFGGYDDGPAVSDISLS